MSTLNQIIRYEPVVSDVSDDELINTVEVLEKVKMSWPRPLVMSVELLDQDAV